ncbi:hypothetical protein EDD22DRAFT_951411 [Suillus occidentalis]|nr:hypothetical protein EDD22DRAFT_951411 [Suillus occidentalis]
MDMDEPSKSRMSLDSLDDIYLGPDDKLDTDSESSADPDILDEIPTQSHLVQADDLSLFNDLDLYLGPKDDLIEFDDALAVPDSPMTVNELIPEPHPASLTVPEAPIPSTPRHQLPMPPLNNEELQAMIQEFMPIGSYNQTEIQTIVDCLGDYQQHYGYVPDPTIAQLLEADRPFQMAWTETCDKLQKGSHLGPHNDPVAWKIVREFASSEMSLPEAETRLEHHLTDHYADTDWRPALKAIMDAEGDIDAALNAIRIPARPKTLTQVTSLETELMDSIDELKSRNRIFGKPPTVKELLDPVEEREVGGHDYKFPGGDKDIVEEVQRQMAIERGDIIEVDSDSEEHEEDEKTTPEYTFTEVIALSQQLEEACLQFGELGASFDLLKWLQAFRACVRREEIRGAKQRTIDSFFGK